MIELLPGAPYEARYIASQAAIGFAFDSQRGVHAIGSDRIRPFYATPNGLAFVPMGCDVFFRIEPGRRIPAPDTQRRRGADWRSAVQ